MAKISYVAGAALTRGQLVDLQADDSLRVYPASDTTNPPAGIVFEGAASGSYATVWAAGTAQCYAIASGTIAAGDMLIGGATAGQVAAGTFPLVSGSFVVGYAETDATNGNPVYISFVPSAIN